MIDWKISISAVFVGLLTGWIGHRFAARRSERQNYCNKVIEFEEFLIPFLKELESPDANPAVLVTQYFPEHDEAARKLMLHIPQKKQKRFLRKWQLYEALYEEKQSQGPMNIFAAEVDDTRKLHLAHRVRLSIFINKPPSVEMKFAKWFGVHLKLCKRFITRPVTTTSTKLRLRLHSVAAHAGWR